MRVAKYYIRTNSCGRAVALCSIPPREQGRVLLVFAQATIHENKFRPGQFWAVCNPLGLVSHDWIPKEARRSLELRVHQRFSSKLRIGWAAVEEYLVRCGFQPFETLSVRAVAELKENSDHKDTNFLLCVDVDAR